MPHDWILDVLADLHAYARRNDLPGLARKMEEAARELRGEADGTEAVPLALAFPPRHRAN